MITDIGRYFVGNPNLVAIVTTDNLSVITAADYIADQADNIEELQNGEFQWADTDILLISYGDGQGWFTRDSTNDTFVSLPVAGASHNIVFADEHTTVGGSATEAITVTGVLATDLVFAQLETEGAVARTILTAATSADTVTITFSGDPAADHVVAYQVIRAV